MDCIQPFSIAADIAGIGVRISFYVQNILLVLLMKRSHADTENALWTFVATSFGLTVAALVQVRSRNLSFLDGILVSQLVWFANLGTFLALASYSRSKGRDVVIKLAATLQGYFSMILTIIMWQMHAKLPSGTCSSIKFVFLFGVELSATGSGRVAGLTIASLALVIFTIVTAIELWVWVDRGRHQPSVTGVPEIELGLRDEHRGARPEEHRGARPEEHRGTRSGHHRSHIHEPTRHHQHHRRHDKFHIRWAGALANLGSFFFGILLSQLVIFVYFVSTTELIIKRSHAREPSTWTFGQVLAIVVVIPSVLAFLRSFKYRRRIDTTNNLHWSGPRASTENGQPPSVPHHPRDQPRSGLPN